METSRIETEFRKQTNQISRETISNAISDVSYVFDQLKAKYQSLSKDKQEAYHKLAEFLDKLKKTKRSMQELKRIDFLQLTQSEQKKQREYNDRLQQLQEVISILNIDLISFSQSPLYDEETKRILDTLTIKVLNQENVEALMNSVNIVNGDVDKKILESEMRIRQQLSKTMGDAAFQLTIPQLNYNPLGNLESSFSAEHIGNTLRQNLQPFEDMEKSFVELFRGYREQVKIATETKNKKEIEILRAVEDKLKNITEDTADEDIDEILQDFVKSLNNSVNESQSAYGKSSIYDYSEDIQKSIADVMSILLTKQKALEDTMRTLRMSRLSDREKKLMQVDMIRNAIITLEEGKADAIVKYMEAVGQIVSDGESKHLQQAYRDVMDNTSAIYANISDTIRSDRMRRLSGTKLSTNMYDMIDPLNNNINGGTLISSKRNSEYLDLVKKAQYGNQFINNNLKGLLGNPISTSSPLDSNMDIRVAAPMIANAAQQHINLLNATDVNGISYRFANNEEKQMLDSALQSSKEMISMIDRALIVFDKIKKDDVEFNLLKEQKAHLEAHVRRIEDVKNSMDGLSRAIAFVSTAKDKMLSLLKGSLMFLGIGTILSPIKQLMLVKEKMNEIGRIVYKTTVTDYSMGLDFSAANTSSLSFGIPKSYFDLTYGQIAFPIASNFYHGLVKNVGGHYNAGSPRRDLNYFTRNLLADKSLYEIDDKNIQDFLKTFYKDLGMSAKDTLSSLRNLESFAISSNIPMHKLLTSINGMTESLRAIGVSTEATLNSVTALSGWNGFRVEEGVELVNATAQASNAMSKDWGRSLFWGLMSGDNVNSFDIILQGTKTHTATGKTREEYLDTMVDRLIKESTFFGSRWGESNLNSVDMIGKLMEQNFSQKQAVILTNLFQEGKMDEFREKIKGYDKLNDSDAPQKTTKELADQLHTSAEQLGEIVKIQNTFTSYIYNIANIIDKNLSPILDKGEKWIAEQIKKYTNVMRSLIMMSGGFFKSPVGNALLDTFKEHPFYTMGGLVVAGGLARFGVRTGMKTIADVARGKVSTDALKPFLAAGAIGGTVGAYATEYGLSQQEQLANGEEPLDYGQVFLRMISDGTALTRVIAGREVKDDRDDYVGNLTNLLVLGGSPVLAYMFAKRFFTRRTMQRFNRIYQNVQIRAQHPELAYPQKSQQLKNFEQQLRNNVRLNQQDWNRYRQLKTAHEANMNAYRQRRRENARIRRQNRMANEEYRNRVARRMANREGRSNAKGLRKSVGLMVLFDMFFGDQSHSIGSRVAADTIDATLLYGLSKKFGTPGALVALGASMYGHQPLVETIDSFLGRKTEASALFDETHDDYKKMSNEVYESNEQLTRDAEEYFRKHGLSLEDITEKEKYIFLDKFNQFIRIFGDYKKAIEHAAMIVVTGSYGDVSYGGLQGGVEIFKNFKQQDPITASYMEEAAKQFGVPVEDLAMLGFIESHLNPNAGTNSAGATGIMQNTSDHGSGYDIHTVKGNIFASAYFYKWLLEYFRGDKAKAFAGYNLGAGYYAFDLKDWYNHLPEETSDYLVQAGLATGVKGSLTLTNGSYAPTQRTTNKNIGSDWDKWIGQRMYYGSQGCVEAVTKIGSEYSSFLAEELDQGVVNVGVLMADAGNRVIAFNENNVECGDVIVYDNGEHVVIADGNGGYIGNSTYWEQIVEDGNLYAMSGMTPTHLIKVGGGGRPGAYRRGLRTQQYKQNKPKTLLENYESSIRQYQKAVGGATEQKGRIINGMYIDTNKQFESIDKTISDLKKQNQFYSTFNAEANENATREYLNRAQEVIERTVDENDIATQKEKKTQMIRGIVEKIRKVAGDYFVNPEIVCDI